MNTLPEGVTLREFFDERFNNLNAKLDQVLAKQDVTNGRVRKAEVAIAVLTWAYSVGAAVLAAWFLDLFQHVR